MGSLKPGATYIYERADGVTYAREMCANPSERFPIGWDLETQQKLDHIKRTKLWVEILTAAETDQRLQEELNRVIMLYHLSKNNGQE